MIFICFDFICKIEATNDSEFVSVFVVNYINIKSKSKIRTNKEVFLW